MRDIETMTQIERATELGDILGTICFHGEYGILRDALAYCQDGDIDLLEDALQNVSTTLRGTDLVANEDAPSYADLTGTMLADDMRDRLIELIAGTHAETDAVQKILARLGRNAAHRCFTEMCEFSDAQQEHW